MSKESSIDTPSETVKETFNGSLFGAIFAVNTAVTFINLSDQGDLLAVMLTLGMCSLALFVPIQVMYIAMKRMSDNTYQKHKIFLVSTYLFISTVFKWVSMLAFSVFTRWLPGAFLNEPHLVNYLLFLLLTFFAVTFIMVVSSSDKLKKPAQ